MVPANVRVVPLSGRRVALVFRVQLGDRVRELTVRREPPFPRMSPVPRLAPVLMMSVPEVKEVPPE
jgi:hypothetical protein